MPNARTTRSTAAPARFHLPTIVASAVAAISFAAADGRAADCDDWAIRNDGLVRSGVRLGTTLAGQRQAVTRVMNGSTPRWLDDLKIDTYIRGHAQTPTMEVYACSPDTEIIVGTVIGQAESSRSTQPEWIRDQQLDLATIARAPPVKEESATDIYLWVVKEQLPVGTTDLRDAVIHRRWCRKAGQSTSAVCSAVGWEVYRVRTHKDLP
jgi:hypothetical protein